MVSLPVYDKTGAEVGKYDIDPAEIAPKIQKQLIHDAVVMYQANLRLGTVKTKGRSEVAGSTKKMYRQKGTGNARAGSRRSGVRRGGGHIHAMHNRDWSYRLPRKALRLATRMALATRIQDNQVVLINELSASEPKTKPMAELLKKLKLSGKTVLVAIERQNENLYKSLRNIDGVSVLPVSDLNALSILRPKTLVLTTAAMDALRQAADRGKAGATQAS